MFVRSTFSFVLSFSCKHFKRVFFSLHLEYFNLFTAPKGSEFQWFRIVRIPYSNCWRCGEINGKERMTSSKTKKTTKTLSQMKNENVECVFSPLSHLNYGSCDLSINWPCYIWYRVNCYRDIWRGSTIVQQLCWTTSKVCACVHVCVCVFFASIYTCFCCPKL